LCSGNSIQPTRWANVGQYIIVLPALDLVVAHKTLPAEPGQPVRGVTHRQYHAALLQLIKARCGRACP